MIDLDRECNALFRRLDELKAAGREGDAEYMRVLYELRDKTRQRVADTLIIRA